MGAEYTILVNSCDAYAELWTPFFLVLKEKWKDLDCEIVLNTETKSFEMEGLNIRTFNLGKESKKYHWGKRLRETLARIDTEYVISLFDDFILEADVNIDKIMQCLAWMEQNKKIAVFYLMNIPQPNQEDGAYAGFELVPQEQDYRLNSAPAIWRKEKLLQYTGDVDTPWAWEYFGSVRTFYTDDLFYCVDKKTAPIYHYAHKLGGAIHRGKWVKSVIEPVVNKYALNMDLSVRGYENEETNCSGHTLMWKIKFFCLGYKMIGKDAWKMLFRYLKIKVKG